MLKRIVKDLEIRNTSYVFLANVFSKILSFVIFFMLAKYLSVKNYGVLVVLLAIIITITDLINSGLNSSIIRLVARYKSQDNYRKINEIVSTMFFNYLFIGIIIIIVLIIFSSNIYNALLHEDNSSRVIWISFGILFTFLYGIFSAVFQGLEDYKNYLIQTISLPGTRLIVLLISVISQKFTLDLIIILYALSPLVGLFVGMFLTKNVVDISFSNYSLNAIKEIGKFGKWMFLWGVFIILQSRINTYLLSILTTPEQVSYYEVANKFIGLVMILFTSYGTTLNPRLARMINASEIRGELKKINKIMVLFTGYLIVSSAIIPIAINIMFGIKYEMSINIFVILNLFNICFIWNAPYNSCLFALGKSNVFFIDAVITMVVTLIASIILLPKYGAIGAAFSQGIATCVSLLISRVAYSYYMKEEEVVR